MVDIKYFSSILNDMLTWILAHQNKITDVNEGSIIRSKMEAIALEIEQLYIKCRVGFSSSLKDVAFIAFNFQRQAGQKASGTVVFSRTGTSGTVDIPSGTILSTSDGIQFVTTAAGQILNTFSSSAAITIQASVLGINGNVLPATITVIITPITGVDTVTNASTTTGGLDEESDSELLERFQTYIEGLSKSNIAGLIAGAKEVAGVRSASVVEHFPPSSSYNVTVYIDDGAGNAPADLITAVTLKLVGDGTLSNPGYKAGGINLRVLAPSKITITVQVEIVDDGTMEQSTMTYLIQTALMNYINNLGLGEDVILNRLIDTIMDCQGVYDLTMTLPASNTTISSTQIARISTSDITITYA